MSTITALTNSDLALVYGVSMALFFAAAFYMWVFALALEVSQVDSDQGLSEATSIFLLTGMACALFGLFNVYALQLHFTEIRNILPDLWFTLGKFSAPLALLCFTRMFTKSTPIKSLDAFIFWLKQEKYYNVLYVIDVIFILALFFVRDPLHVVNLSLLLFVPHCLAGVVFSFNGLSAIKLSRFYGILFLITALTMLVLALTSTTIGLDNLPTSLMMLIHIGLGVMVLLLSFVVVKFNQEENTRFNDISKVKMKKFFEKIYTALNNEEFHLVYQPKLDLKTGQPCGVEALLRWAHPKDGNIPPNDFIPAAEQTNIIDNICQWTIRRAVQDARVLLENNIDLPISINFSVRNLHPDMIHYLYDVLQEHQVPVAAIMVEITESLYIDQSEEQTEALKLMRQLEIKLSLDDYGAGFSSLSHLDQLGINEIKIDKFFIINMEKSDKNLIIVNSTIKMGHALGISVVAEGVENDMVRARLSEMKCDRVQGFGIARPMPLEQTLAWLHEMRHD